MVAQVAKVILAEPAALVVLMSPVAKVVVTALVILVAATRVFEGSPALATKLVLNVQVASAGSGKLMVFDSEDLSKFAFSETPFYRASARVLIILVNIETQMDLAAVRIIPETLAPRSPRWSCLASWSRES